MQLVAALLAGMMLHVTKASGLPKGWKTKVNTCNGGEIYYENVNGAKTTTRPGTIAGSPWELPKDWGVYVRTGIKCNNLIYYKNPKTQKWMSQHPIEKYRIPINWVRAIHVESGDLFYHNMDTKEVTWKLSDARAQGVPKARRESISRGQPMSPKKQSVFNKFKDIPLPKIGTHVWIARTRGRRVMKYRVEEKTDVKSIGECIRLVNVDGEYKSPAEIRRSTTNFWQKEICEPNPIKFSWRRRLLARRRRMMLHKRRRRYM